MIRFLRRRFCSESGVTIMELIVAMLMFSIVTVIFLTVLASVQGTVNTLSGRSASNDQARLAVEELDREIRSGNVLYDPSLENDSAHGVFPGMSLRVYTQTNASTRSPGNQCVQWRVFDQQLQRRAWSVNWRTDDIVTGWRVVAEKIMNQTPFSNQSQWVRAFTLDPFATYGNRIVNITILAQGRSSSGQTVRIAESVTGRNTEYGYPNNICTDIPPY
jgi:type II secretory pathway component PulJ